MFQIIIITKENGQTKPNSFETHFVPGKYSFKDVEEGSIMFVEMTCQGLVGLVMIDI